MRTASLPAPANGSPGMLGWALGLSWFGIMSAGPVAFWGAQQLFAQPPAFLAMLAAVAGFPAIALMMIAGAWRTSWLTAQRLDAAIETLTEEIRRRGDDPEGGGPRIKPDLELAPPQIKSTSRPPVKPARTAKPREPLAPAIQGFAEDSAPAPKTPKRDRREKTLASSVRSPRKTAKTAPAPRKPAKPAQPRPVPAIEALASVAPPPRTARPQPTRPARAPARPSVEPVAEAPPPIVDRVVRRNPAPPRVEAPRIELPRTELSRIETLSIEPPPIAEPPIDTAQRAVVDLTAMRRRRRAMRLGA